MPRHDPPRASLVPRVALVALAAAALAATAGCNRPAGEAATVKIGMIGPLTGDQAKQGVDIRNGVQLAVDEWNAKGGVLGKQIELLVEDDAQDPKQAVNVAWKLSNLGVAGVVGEYHSSCTIPASEVLAKKSIPMITPASTNPQVTDRGLGNMFRVCGRDDQQGLVAARYVADKLPETRVAVLHDRTTYGQGFAEEFRKSYRKLTSKEEVFFGGIVREDQDFTAVLTDVKGYSPDVIFFGGLYPQAALLVRQARQLGLDARWFSGDGTFDPEFVRIAGKENAEGTLLTFIPDQLKIPTAKRVIAAYQARFGEVGPYSVYGYTAAQVLLEGIDKAGTTDGVAIAAAIHANAFDTPFGQLQFDQKGDVLRSPYVVWDTQDGKYVQMTEPGE
jgi:branched-chain amino acid transport system substrate-binding protein